MHAMRHRTRITKDEIRAIVFPEDAKRILRVGKPSPAADTWVVFEVTYEGKKVTGCVKVQDCTPEDSILLNECRNDGNVHCWQTKIVTEEGTCVLASVD